MKFIVQVEFDIPGPLPENWVDDGYLDSEDDYRLHGNVTTELSTLRYQLIGQIVKVKSGELENALIGEVISVEEQK